MKSIKKNILVLNLIIVVSLFYGCSQSATSVFKKEPIYAQNLQYTRIGKLIIKDEVKALINVTYLNSVDSTKWNNGSQNFLVGTYIPSKTKENYTLRLNGKENNKSIEIKKSHKMYKNIAFRNHWATYNILSFDDTEEKIIKLIYSDLKDNSITITFIKE
jgi:muconolactone delta-isomerase